MMSPKWGLHHYSPAYVKTDLTDKLHELFGFRTDYEIVPYENFKKIFQHTKKDKVRKLKRLETLQNNNLRVFLIQ